MLMDISTERTALLKGLARQYGTPLYVYDTDEIVRRLDELRRATTSHARIFYSAKANPLLAPVLVGMGVDIEVTSLSELDAVGDGCRNCLFGGPAQTVREMREALSRGVQRFSIESFDQLLQLDWLVGELRTSVPEVILRINPRRAVVAKLSMTGTTTQFGIDIESLTELKCELRALSNVNLIGIHTYLGTQIQVLDVLEACHISRETLDEAQEVLGRQLAVLNVGGGFPWPYGHGRDLDLQPLNSDLNQFVEKMAREGHECWFESGRYLAASSGTLVFSVIDSKIMKGREFVLADAGVHCLGGMSALGRTLRSQVDVVALAASIDRVPDNVTLTGPLCTPLDIIAKNVPLKGVRAGDLLAIRNIGAYGLTASLVAFLGKRLPVEVVIKHGQIERAVHLRLAWEEC